MEKTRPGQPGNPRQQAGAGYAAAAFGGSEPMKIPESDKKDKVMSDDETQ
jgi:hypothetical protein